MYQQRLQEIYPQVQQRLQGKPMEIIRLTAEDEARARVVEEMLIEQEIDRVNPTADEELVQQELKKLLKKQETKQQLKQAGNDRERVIARMREQLYRRLQAYEIMEGAMSQDLPTEEDAKEFYSRNEQQFKLPEQVHASHILVKGEGEDSKARIEQAARELKDGRDFAEAAKEYSGDASAAKGGDLGWVPRGQVVPDFEKEVFALAAGGVSAPFQTQFGWHIVKLHEHQEPRQQPIEEVREQIAMMLIKQHRHESYAKFLDELKSRATIEEVKG